MRAFIIAIAAAAIIAGGAAFILETSIQESAKAAFTIPGIRT
jgi:hypothetical protein